MVHASIGLMAMFISFSSMAFSLPSNCVSVPAVFTDNRIYLNFKTAEGDVRLYTDSGGGLYPFVYDDTSKKLRMTVIKRVEDEGQTIGLSNFPKALREQGLLTNQVWRDSVRVFTFDPKGKGEANEIRFILGDGFLGATFFADRIWHFNYLKQKLEACSKAEPDGYVSTPLSFKTANGVRSTHQPRVEVEILGEKLSVLFDTGATSFYSAEAQKTLKPLKAFTASSFIRESVIKRWLKTNPKLHVIQAGDKFSEGGDLVEIPLLKIANVEVGPVWFATRNDKIYDRYSRDIMDANIDGAIGGNAFQYLEMIADYPGAKLYVRKASK